MRFRVAAALCACGALAACASAPDRSAAPTRAGPAQGTLFIAGGGDLAPDLLQRFVRLAGGADATIVIVPTAGTAESFPAGWAGLQLFAGTGARQISVLHTRSRAEADSEEFTAPLRTATGVWFSGGRQWRLTDVYLGTRTQREIERVLARGGVVGGTSAGASVQASFMVRGATESNTIMMAPGRQTGLGLLRDAAVDQHLTARGRQDDMLQVVDRHPDLLGIGVDEGTALIVNGDHAEIVGRGRVAFYNAADSDTLPYYFLAAGSMFDLRTRSTTRGVRVRPQIVRDEAAILRVVNDLFAAMRARDTAAIRGLFHDRVRITVPVVRNDSVLLRVSTVDQFIASIAAATERLDERAIDPEARVDDNLGWVWTEYDFRVGTTFSHCGTDAFHFLKAGDRWLITALAYTIRREGCTR